MNEHDSYKDPFYVGLEILQLRGEDPDSVVHNHSIPDIVKIGRSVIQNAMEFDENDWSKRPEVAFFLGTLEYDENTA